jgi:hypothetical protein
MAPSAASSQQGSRHSLWRRFPKNTSFRPPSPASLGPVVLPFAHRHARSRCHRSGLWRTENNEQMVSSNPGWERERDDYAGGLPGAHAAEPAASRNRCMALRNSAIWFQLGGFWDESLLGSSINCPTVSQKGDGEPNGIGPASRV